MDDVRFDRVARAVATEAGTRRGVIWLLVGSVVGNVAARLGLAEVAAAKPKRKRRKHRTEPKERSTVQAEKKGKKKGKGKGKKKPPPLPPGCQHCGECQMCQDGACVPDSDLNGVRCLASGAACGYCQGGQCVASVVRPCADGVCPRRGQCCPEEKRCTDLESPTGFTCVGPDDCCPNEKRCRDECIPRDTCCDEDSPQCGPCEELFCNRHGVWICSKQCCPGQKDCGGGVCVAEDECCPDETPCDDGSCAAPGQCCPDLYQCEDGTCVDPFDECCPGQKRCDDDTCISEDQCCPGEQRCGDSACMSAPPCSFQCGEVVCEDGELVCRPRNSGETCAGPGTACCNGRCYSASCPPVSNGQPRHFNPTTCGCECDVVESCPPGKGWSHSTCECVCNCAGRCCLSGCCVRGPGNSPYCCQGY